ncbi:MAG: DUF58 domain-containing protein [Phycisphaerales bacterium]|nr:DUF58 domain-containing protein [Phycisphaerales bacterium]
MAKTIDLDDVRRYLHPRMLARLRTLELRARQIVEGVTVGMHRSPYHGFSIEFAQHRPYAAGDDVRHLDWKVFGRSDKLYLKQYEQETNLDLLIFVDSSGSMAYGSTLDQQRGDALWRKFDHATALAAALSYIALRQGDRVSVVIFADSVRDVVPSSSAMQHWRRIVSALSTHTVDQPTDIERSVEQVLATTSKRKLIAIISDAFDDPPRIRAALGRVKHGRHDLMLFQVLDRQERMFLFDQPTAFEGLEGEGRLRIDPRALRDGYLDALRMHIERIRTMTRSFGFEYQLIDTHEWLGPPLSTFLARRSMRFSRAGAR